MLALALSGSIFFIWDRCGTGVSSSLFSKDMPSYLSLIASFSTFVVGFLVLPLVGVIFWHYSDRFGGKKVLIIALTLMGVSATLVGLLPIYSQIGFLALL